MKQQRVEYYNNAINWYFNGEFHRDGDLPDEYSFRDGKLITVTYCQHRKLHRTTGPAVINYKYKIKEYWYQSKQYAGLEEIKMIEACR